MSVPTLPWKCPFCAAVFDHSGIPDECPTCGHTETSGVPATWFFVERKVTRHARCTYNDEAGCPMDCSPTDCHWL